MTALIGRKMKLKKGPAVSAVALIGSRQDDVDIKNTEVDITDKGDNGYRTLMGDWGSRAVDVSVSGVFKSPELITIVTSASGSVLLQDYTVEIEGVGNFEGDFFLNGLRLGAPHDKEVTFSGTFLSSGAYTYTPDS